VARLFLLSVLFCCYPDQNSRVRKTLPRRTSQLIDFAWARLRKSGFGKQIESIAGASGDKICVHPRFPY
jgi:hypothetical protein